MDVFKVLFSFLFHAIVIMVAYAVFPVLGIVVLVGVLARHLYLTYKWVASWPISNPESVEEKEPGAVA